MTPPECELSLIHHGPEDQVNVFIHGYSAIASAQHMDRLIAYVLAARPPGRVYLLYWRSGNWRRNMATPLVTAGLRVFKITRMFHPAALAADAAATIGMHSYHFKKKERLAERLGRHLPTILEEIPDIHHTPLNLFGHSLGGRAIQVSLQANDWEDFNLQNCFVMASAGDRDAIHWDQAVQKINGRFFNAYSKNDLTLKMSPDLRSRVGRHPIPSSSDKIIDVHFPHLRHTEYWPRLPEIIETAWPEYVPSEHIIVDEAPIRSTNEKKAPDSVNESGADLPSDGSRSEINPKPGPD